jgi:4-amino-4-deoxy-L-arabinose transferase-like glycosyltransferase
MTFFCVVALWFAMGIAERPGLRDRSLGAGLAFGGAFLCKYTGGFVLGVIGLAYVISPSRPKTFTSLTPWVRWAARGMIPIVVGSGYLPRARSPRLESISEIPV